jgi:hypothetical protein
MAKLVESKDVELVTRQYLKNSGYSLSSPRKLGETDGYNSHTQGIHMFY